jgi:hypothetical protein
MKPLPVAFVALISACALAQPATSPAYFLEQQTFRVTHQAVDGDIETPLTMTREYHSSTGDLRNESFSIRPNTVPPDFHLDTVHISPHGGKSYDLDPDKHTAMDLLAELNEQYRKWLNEVVVGSFLQPTETTEDLGDRTIFGVSVKGTRTTNRYHAERQAGHATVDAYDIVTESWRSQDPPIEMESRRIDPHDGEVVMKTTKFARGEPDPQLFRIPSGYRVIE